MRKLNLTLGVFVIIILNIISCSKCEDEELVTIIPYFKSEACEITSDVEETSRCATKQMLIHLYGNLEYPEEAKANQIEGTVTVEFDIGKDGIPTNHEVTSGIGHGCDEEALKVVRTFLFTPAKNNCGNKIVSHMGVNVKFTL